MTTKHRHIPRASLIPAMRSAASEPQRTLLPTKARHREFSASPLPLCVRYMASVILLLLFTAIAVKAAGPKIEFPETSKSLGTFRLDLIQTVDFEFVNTGDEPLLILNVNTDCGCTAAGYPHDEIAPGDTAKISVRYNGRNNPTGTFRKQVRVRTNDPDNPLVRLFIKGKAIKG